MAGGSRGWQGGIRERATGITHVMGADETIVKVRGKAKFVEFVADAERGRLVER